MYLADAIAAIGVLIIGWTIYKAHQDPRFKEFNLLDLLMDNGRVSRLAFVFLGSWVMMLWIMARLVMKGQMTEGYFSAFATACFAPLVIRLFAPPKPLSPDEPDKDKNV